MDSAFTQPTIKDVARVAKVHFTTVSMALRGHPSIPQSTRDRIIAIADRIGYKRNSMYAALTYRRQKLQGRYVTPKIAYIANVPPEHGFLDFAFNRQFLEGARGQAEALGYGFEVLFVAPGHFNSHTLDQHLKKNGVSGIIIGAFEAGRAGLDLDWNEYCSVKIDSRHMEPAVTFVSNDQLHAVRCAFDRMRTLGYRRIGLAVGQSDEEGTDGMNFSGLFQAQRGLPAQELVPPLLFPHAATSKEAVPMLRDWIQTYSVDAVLCNWANARSMIRGAGFRCPEEVACAGLCLPKASPAVAGIVANLRLVGEHVTSLLGALLRTGQRGVPAQATATYVQGYWHDGASAPGRSDVQTEEAGDRKQEAGQSCRL